MADAFRLWGPNPSGTMSNPILVSGSGPKPASPIPPEAMARLLSDSSATGDDWSVVPLLRQMADLRTLPSIGLPPLQVVVRTLARLASNA